MKTRHRCNFEDIKAFLEKNRTRSNVYLDTEIYDNINVLLSQDLIEVQQEGSEMYFAAVSEQHVKKFQNMDNIEKEIFKVLQQSGDMGCTIGELKQ